MKKLDLEILFESILPKLYGLSFALCNDEAMAQQLVVDAYTVFIMREKDFVSDMDFDTAIGQDRVATKRYLYCELIREIFELGLKRKSQFQLNSGENFEFDNYFDLPIQKRAILYLKEIAKLDITDLQEIFSLQRHQVLESLHNSHFCLTQDLLNNEMQL